MQARPAGRLLMNVGLSDQVRALARSKYVHPAILAGKRQFSIPVRDLLEELLSSGFPARNTPQVCSALRTMKFLRDNGLEIESVDGPPSKQSPTVVVRYRVSKQGEGKSQRGNQPVGEGIRPDEESPEEWAFRLTEKLRGLLKEELADYGGGEAFLRWVRSEDDENAA